MYYKVTLSKTSQQLWLLDEPEDKIGQIDVFGEFTICQRFEGNCDLRIDIIKNGVSPDFSFGSFMTPLLSTKLHKAVFRCLDKQVDFIPVEASDGRLLYVLNALNSYECFDFENSQYDLDEAESKNNAEPVLKTVVDLFVLPKKVPVGSHVFRLSNWITPLIISAELREELMNWNTEGLEFTPVVKNH